MKITIERVLNKLPMERPCIGAVFTAYSFDPAFFESHVLRSVLRMTSDPEQILQFHSEACRALQETPVVAMVAAGKRQPGRRLPYDLLEISNVVFHPKSVLLLYRELARLMVGSGNLTPAGYGENTELFLALDLDYENTAHADLLRIYDAHLDRISKLTRQNGTQLKLFREELSRRLGNGIPSTTTSQVTLLDSTIEPIMMQLAGLIPTGASIERIGMLAPFFELDDDKDLDVASVFGAFLMRTDHPPVLDVGVAWDNPEVHADSVVNSIENGLGRIWGWSYGSDHNHIVEYLIPASVGRTALVYTDQHGDRRRCSLEDARAAVNDRSLWMLPHPIAFAPRKKLNSARKKFDAVRLWLYPELRLVEGRPMRRPLHAKLLLVAYSNKGKEETLVLMGSANMSRRALLLEAGPTRGNVELGVTFRLKGYRTLIDFMPELVSIPLSALKLQERNFPNPERNYALAIDEAIHDPKMRTLTVKWGRESANLPPWRLIYDTEELARSDTAPISIFVAQDFTLRPASADIFLHVKGHEFPVPILVTNLNDLPPTPSGVGLSLKELLLLLGRRIGTERAIQIAQRRAKAPQSDPLDQDDLVAFFGEEFGPTDVFRAWWSAAEDLSDPVLSVPGFRLCLEGGTGIGETWTRMLDAFRDEKSLEASTVWLYGAELLRALDEVKIPSGVDSDAKAVLLARFRLRVRIDLEKMRFDSDESSWVLRIRAFYGQEKS